MAMESKKLIYDLIPSRYIPKTLLFHSNTTVSQILKKTSEANIHFPMIAKPDIGMKAFGVEKIDNSEALASYVERISTDFLIQEMIEFPNEVGIFYIRFPKARSGWISGIVSKEFLTVTGNGRHTIYELITQDPRTLIQLSFLKKKYGTVLNQVLPAGTKQILVPYGSHTRGAKFVDITSRINTRLLRTIDSICSKIPGFYFGRLDIRYATFEALSAGRNFSIIEINGAGSEPTHIYDPRHSLFFAWREIIRHWNLLCRISMDNNRNGVPYLSFSDGKRMIRENRKLEARLKVL